MLPTRLFCTVIFAVLAIQSSGVCQERDQFVSDASFWVGTYQPAESDHSPSSMAETAQAFLASLTEQQRGTTVHAIDSAERQKWTNLPTPRNAEGVRFGEMTQAQSNAACDLIASLLSESGYKKMVGIMLADDQLLRRGRARSGFGVENFHVVIFGTPSATEPWAFQLDGHHVGVNLAIHGESLTMSPSFIGSQPQVFELGGEKIRPLAVEVDVAFKLVGLLNDDQRRAAVIGDRRADLVAGPGRDFRVPEADGVSCGTFTDEQKAVLLGLIREWVGDLPAAQAEKRMTQLKEEVNQMKFSWNGATAEGSDISYRIQGPTLMIEFACQSLGGQPLQHLHTMYRNLANEYGMQIGDKE